MPTQAIFAVGLIVAGCRVLRRGIRFDTHFDLALWTAVAASGAALASRG